MRFALLLLACCGPTPVEIQGFDPVIQARGLPAHRDEIRPLTRRTETAHRMPGPVKRKGYLTQCDCAGMTSAAFRCNNTTYLSKPGHWRCPDCERKWGKRPPPPRPTAPMD